MAKKDIVKGETEVDEKMVNDAFNYIRDSYQEHHTNYLEDVADYLADTFFGGDEERIRKNKPIYGKSFNTLCNRLTEEDTHLPKKSWLYSAVNVFVDSKRLEKIDNATFQTYTKLLPSAKVELTRLRDDDNKKIDLIKEANKKKLSVRAIRRRVSELKAKSNDKKKEEKHAGIVTPYNKELNKISDLLKKRKIQVKRSITIGGDEIKEFKRLEKKLEEFIKQLEHMDL